MWRTGRRNQPRGDATLATVPLSSLQDLFSLSIPLVLPLHRYSRTHRGQLVAKCGDKGDRSEAPGTRAWTTRGGGPSGLGREARTPVILVGGRSVTLVPGGAHSESNMRTRSGVPSSGRVAGTWLPGAVFLRGPRISGARCRPPEHEAPKTQADQASDVVDSPRPRLDASAVRIWAATRKGCYMGDVGGSPTSPFSNHDIYSQYESSSGLCP